MEAGDRAAAEVLAVLGGHTLAGMESSVSDTAGARIRRDGAVTIYVRAALAPASGRGLLANAGRGATTLLAEYTTGRGGPRELAFRRAQPGPGSGEVTETVGRLDLRDPANWAIARPLVEARVPWPPQGARDLEAVLRRIAQVGVIERATYAVNDRSGSLDVEVKAGLELGIDVHRTDVSRRLVRASARTQGSRERERYDCTTAAA
jgi:hypothetical protein